MTQTEKVEIKEDSPFQEGIISEIYERPDTSYVQEPQELKDLIDITKVIQKFLPKQTDVDKILEIIKRKVLKGTHLPLMIKEIQADYLSSPYFKDLYLFLSQNKLPSKRFVVKKVETLAESFVLLDSLIFKQVMQQIDMWPVLCFFMSADGLTLYITSYEYIFCYTRGIVS